MSVTFDSESHTYTNEHGIKYISATTLLGNYKPKFDAEKIAERVACREGLLKEDILQYWKDLNRISTDRGTAIHKALEDFLNKGEKSENYSVLTDYIAPEISKHSNYTIKSEEVLFNDEYEIAGTADIILEGENFFKIWDLKTNKDIKFTNTFDDNFLLEPVNHLVNCEYSIYSLQLSLYSFMKERLTGKKCIEQKIIFYENVSDPSKSRIREIYTPYLKSDIEKILEQKK